MLRRKKKVIEPTYSPVALDIATIISKNHVYKNLPRYMSNSRIEYSIMIEDKKITLSEIYTTVSIDMSTRLLKLDKVDVMYLFDLASTKHNDQERIRSEKVRKLEQKKMEETYSVIADIAQSIRVEGELNE